MKVYKVICTVFIDIYSIHRYFLQIRNYIYARIHICVYKGFVFAHI